MVLLVSGLLVAVVLVFLPRDEVYVPRISFAIGESGDIDFLLRPESTVQHCRIAGAAVAAAVTAGCASCRLKHSDCLANPAQEIWDYFERSPVDVPSGSFNGGVVLFNFASAADGLAACRESANRSVGTDTRLKVSCFPAGETRLHSGVGFSRTAQDNLFNSVLLLQGGVLAFVTALVIAAFVASRTIPSWRLSRLAHPKVERLSLAGADLLALTGAFTLMRLTGVAGAPSTSFASLQVAAYLAVTLLTVFWFWVALDHYRQRRPFWDELLETSRTLMLAALLWAATSFLLHSDTSRYVLIGASGLSLILVPVGRFVTRRLLDDLGIWRRQALVVGVGDNARDAWFAVRDDTNMGLELVGFVDTSGDSTALKSISIDGTSYGVFSFPEAVPLFPMSHVIIALDSNLRDSDRVILNKVISTAAAVHLIPPMRGLPLLGTRLSHFFGHEVVLLTLRHNLGGAVGRFLKRFFDLLVASFLLVLLSPLFGVFSLLIRQDGGAALYGHTRVGRGGKPFRCLKFRSMIANSEKVLADLLAANASARREWEQTFKLKSDPRITPIGQFLRRTSLDELPQLINVIRGEMSLVGPRPIVAEELSRYGDSASLYLSALPGMTGLWQVSGRSDTGYDERVYLDTWYVQNWSLWYDVAILFRTVKVVLNRKGAY